VEHLLLAMLDNPSAAKVLRACAADIDELRKTLADFVTTQTPTIAGSGEVDTQPTLGFQRVIQRAILHVQSSGKKEVTGANVLVAILARRIPMRCISSATRHFPLRHSELHLSRHQQGGGRHSGAARGRAGGRAGKRARRRTG